MRVLIDAEGSSQLAVELLGTRPIELGESYEVEPGIHVTYRDALLRRSVEAGDLMTYLVDFARDYSAEAAALWIYTRVKGKVSRLRINGRQVPPAREDILAVLREAQGDE